MLSRDQPGELSKGYLCFGESGGAIERALSETAEGRYVESPAPRALPGGIPGDTLQRTQLWMVVPASVSQFVRRFLQAGGEEDPRFKRILSKIKT